MRKRGLGGVGTFTFIISGGYPPVYTSANPEQELSTLVESFVIRDASDRGAVLENFVFSEIYKAINPLLESVKFWRSKSGAEVDFIVECQGKVSAWEVKAGDCREKITRSSRSFIEAYQPQNFFVVNDKIYSEQQMGKTCIRFIEPASVGSNAREMWRSG